MTNLQRILLSFLIWCPSLRAQQDSIMLREVTVTDTQLRRFSSSRQVVTLGDSLSRLHGNSFTELLQFHTTLYFKENGGGSGVSSPAFRGTTAQQTAVVWNGININSQFNGQTDFNAISGTGFSNISVRSGGGSVVYGSSAIGGSVHLEDELHFYDHFSQLISADYGSFNTQRYRYGVEAGTKRFAFRLAAFRNTSDNDFSYPDGNRKNENGQYENSGIEAAAGIRLNSRNYLRYFGEVYDGERHFSLLTPSDTRTKYQDINFRNLLEWTNVGARFTSKARFAYLEETYRYFENLSADAPARSSAASSIVKYDLSWRATKKLLLNALVDYTRTDGSGTDISKNRREIASAVLLLSHKPTGFLSYEAGIRKELTDNYESPLLYSAGAKLQLSSRYALRVNGSRNFRIPTFNDLYWIDGGNPELRPESSYQAEIGNDLDLGTWKLSVNGYYIDIKDMIQWLPGTTAAWNPQNVNRVKAYGGEFFLRGELVFGHHRLTIDGNYAYTVSRNVKTGQQLIYVPFHKATGAIVYRFRRFSADVQALANGEVFTRSDNDSRYNLDGYAVVNSGIGYGFGKDGQYRIGMQLHNLLGAEYYTQPKRPYPGRNYNLSLTLIL